MHTGQDMTLLTLMGKAYFGRVVLTIQLIHSSSTSDCGMDRR